MDTSFSFVHSFSLLSHFCLFVREGGDDILSLVDISPIRFLAALRFFCLVLPNRILLLPFAKSIIRISTVIKDM